MEQIILNLTDPSWWFTGIFFVVLGILLTQLLYKWLPGVWVKISIIKPSLSQKFNRWKERRILLKVKRYRQHEVNVNWLIGRYWCLATVSILYLGFLMISFLISSNFTEIKLFELKSMKKLVLFLPIVVPAYLLLFFTLWEKEILKRTIKAHIMWKKLITKSVEKDAQ